MLRITYLKLLKKEVYKNKRTDVFVWCKLNPNHFRSIGLCDSATTITGIHHSLRLARTSNSTCATGSLGSVHTARNRSCVSTTCRKSCINIFVLHVIYHLPQRFSGVHHRGTLFRIASPHAAH